MHTQICLLARSVQAYAFPGFQPVSDQDVSLRTRRFLRVTRPDHSPPKLNRKVGDSATMVTLPEVRNAVTFRRPAEPTDRWIASGRTIIGHVRLFGVPVRTGGYVGRGGSRAGARGASVARLWWLNSVPASTWGPSADRPRNRKIAALLVAVPGRSR
jgi:hypothetical protein